ncbi:uncharacterized protein LOC131244094 [Magnolia sinica]|uniref:uncharacterized protein LOC131244094 n=1 Tax=Magnolia sinica TaxID=86752 RepID=UPI0026583E52|nr:uncharacterized protein LOC131244094 [Magnolia sinica]
MAMKTQTPLLSLLILITVLGGAHAAGYTPTPSVGVAPPPPFEVAGKPFPPQSFQCNNAASKCYGQELKCPKQCPEFKPADPKAKACFVDCNSPKCEAVCRKRKPNCEGIGAACYDPRFVGGDGIMFYFHGKTNHHFSLVSDSNLQINARFIGRRPQGRSRDNTWIQALGIMYGPHTFTVAANKVSQWKYDVDQLLFTYNNMPVFIDEGHLSSWTAPDSSLVVDRTAMCNSIMIILPHVVEISINVVPITKEDDRIHNYQIPSNDCFAHLEVQFRFFKLSDRVEGVLGQTYRPNFQNPVKRGVRMPVMGGEDKFMTSRLLSADCKNCIFNTPKISSAARALVLDPTSTMDCTSKMSKGQGVVCRR